MARLDTLERQAYELAGGAGVDGFGGGKKGVSREWQVENRAEVGNYFLKS